MDLRVNPASGLTMSEFTNVQNSTEQLASFGGTTRMVLENLQDRRPKISRTRSKIFNGNRCKFPRYGNGYC